MKLFLTSLGLTLVFSCWAQNISEPEGYEAKENVRELGSIGGIGNVRTFDNRYEGVKGSPYVFEEWYPGEVYLNGKEKLSIKALNYNCFDNEIAYKDPSTQVIRLLNRAEVDLFSIETPEGEMTFAPMVLKEDSDPLFAQLLYNKKSLAYKLYQKDFVRANYEGGYSADRKYDEFVDKYDLYFMRSQEAVLYKVKKSKKYMISCFPDKSSEISRYFKENKPDFKNDDDLVALLRYYDSL